MRRALVVAALVALFVVACEAETPTSTATPSAAAPFPTGKYSPEAERRIIALAAAGDCGGLQAEFNVADRNDAATRSRTGSGTADLMSFIDGHMRAAGCYGSR